MAIQSEVQYLAVAVSSADNTLVAAAGAGVKIRVVSAVLVMSGGANTIRFESDTAGTALTGQMDVGNDLQLILPWNPAGWFETAANKLLNLELGATTAVAGVLGYVLVS